MKYVAKDYSLPKPDSCMPVQVWSEKGGNGAIAVVGAWDGAGIEGIKTCITPGGAAITEAAWRGEAVDPATVPLPFTTADLVSETDVLAVRRMLLQAARAAGICIDLGAPAADLVCELREVHPDFAQLVHAVGHLFPLH